MLEKMNWYALYTKPRNEKKVAEKLKTMQVEAYCPTATVIKQWSDRKKKVEQPVLPSYVFVRLPESEREIAFQVAGVVRYVFWLGKPAVIREEEIKLLQEYLSHRYTTVTSNELKPGDKYKLTSGPFAGQNGIVKYITPTKIQLILESLGVLLTLEK